MKDCLLRKAVQEIKREDDGSSTTKGVVREGEGSSTTEEKVRVRATKGGKVEC